MEKITIIKLGGSLITDKSRPMVAREKIIARLAQEIKKEKRFFLEPIKEALKRGVMPLVYGDVVFDQSQGFGIFSTEKQLEEQLQRM